MTKVRVAVIGAGGIGATHLRAYAAWPERCELVGLADVDGNAAAAKAAAYAIPAFTHVPTMLDELRPDAVSICTPPKFHLPIAQEVARRGIACLCEKPPARTVAETEAMIVAFQEHGAPLQFAFCHRFHEPIRQVRALIEAGTLGTVVQIDNRFGFRFDRAGSSWFTDRETAGGGILIDTLVHSLDIFRVLAGDIVRVNALISSTLPIDVEDSASLQVLSDRNIMGAFACSWVTPVSEAQVRVWGTEGEAIVDYAAQSGARYRVAGDADWTVLPFDAPDRFVRQAEVFLTSVRDGSAPHPGPADGLAVMQAIEAAYQSAR